MELFETLRARLTTLSPVHVGGKEQRATPYDYLHYKGWVYLVSEDRLIDFLDHHKKVDDYVREVGIQGHRFRLADFFLKTVKTTLKDNDVDYISGGKKARLIGNDSGMQDFRPFIRDGNGIPYVPGSSIKGVMRTAILYGTLLRLRQQNPSAFKSGIVDKVEKAEPRWLKKSRNPFEWIQTNWLEDFVLAGKKKSPNTDWLRMLHVSDAYSETPVTTEVLSVNVLKKEASGWVQKKEASGKPTTIWVECVPAGTVFEFKVDWDKRLLDSFLTENGAPDLPQNLDDVWAGLTTWAADVTAFEKTFASGHDLQKWYRSAVPNFRLGFGSGMTSTTMAILLPEDTRRKVRNAAGHDRGNDIAPKSRRTWMAGGMTVPLGWAQIDTFPYNHDTGIQALRNRPESVLPAKADLVASLTPHPPEPQAIVRSAPVESLWKGATLSWHPGNHTITAALEGRKAAVRIEADHAFVPESIREKFFKRKTIRADVIVRQIGNSFTIVRIENG